MICYCCCRQSSQKPSIELQKSFRPYLDAVKFNPNTSQAHANAPSLNALDVATLNPRYVFSSPPPRSPSQLLLSSTCKHPNSNHAITDNSPSITTSKMLTLLLEHPRRNNGTLAAPASPPQAWMSTARRSTPLRTTSRATTPPLLVAQTPSTTRKQVTSILQDLVWA